MVHVRFHVPGVRAGESIVLPEEEAEHLTRVLRLGAGAEVAVFDGQGRQFLAKVESVTRKAVVVTATVPLEAVPEPAVPLVLALAVTKGERVDEAIRDAAMLGVVAVQPVISARTETTVAALARARRVERWRRIAISSVKQCGRAVVPEVREPTGFHEYIRRESSDMRLMLVEPRASTGATSLVGVSTPGSAALLIGPEGGWTSEEIGAASSARWLPLTLGQRTLRADAMPVVAISVLQYAWGDL